MTLWQRLFGARISGKALLDRPAPPLPQGYAGRWPQADGINIRLKNQALARLAEENLSARQAAGQMTLYKRIRFASGSLIMRKAIEMIGWTCRLVHFEVDEKTQKLVKDSQPFIIALWHNRLYYGIYNLRFNITVWRHDVMAIISQSDDAELIARVTAAWGGYCSRGSSSRGGLRAVRKLISYTRLNFCPLITPDGPRGPKYECKEGVAALAILTRLPVMPISYNADRKWVFKSWDNFIIPKPFSRIVLSYGPVIDNLNGLEIAEARQQIEEIMRRQTEFTDRWFEQNG